MKVIFLDIDGVLNVYCQSRDKYGCNFHQHFIDNLKEIIDTTNAKIVISSSWRMDGINTMKDMWSFRKLPGTIIDVTPNLHYKISTSGVDIDYCRGDEIQAWLDKHTDVTNYVILDDDSDMLDSQKSNFVQTSNNPTHPDSIDTGYGLTKICTQAAINILK